MYLFLYLFSFGLRIIDLFLDYAVQQELETLIHTVKIYSRDIGMEFGIEKCAIFVIKSGKRQLTDGIKLPNKDKIKTLAENETYK